MANYTENFNLIKPEDDEYYDVADFNENMDVIDAALAGSSGASEMLQGIISPDGQGVRVVKSIQWQTMYYAGKDAAQKTCELNPTVNSSRCIVLMQRLYEGNSYLTNIQYTLSDTSLSAYFSPGGFSSAVTLGFWIIEFY